MGDPFHDYLKKARLLLSGLFAATARTASFASLGLVRRGLGFVRGMAARFVTPFFVAFGLFVLVFFSRSGFFRLLDIFVLRFCFLSVRAHRKSQHQQEDRFFHCPISLIIEL